MSRLIAVLVSAALLLMGSEALAQSTVNPQVPAVGTALTSAPVRNNFAATYSDINGLLLMHQSTTLAGCSSQTQNVGADCLVTNNSSAYLWYKYTGNNGYVLVATINPSVNPPTIQMGLAPISNGHLIANCSGSTGIPGDCTWNSYANQAIGSTDGLLPYHTSGSWGTINTGTSGHTLPILDGTGNTFTNPINSGVPGTTVGGYCLANLTSGSICLQPTTGALDTSVATFPANIGTVAELNLGQTWSALQTFQLGAVVQSSLTVTGSFVATGLVTNADLVNSSVTVNGTVCTLGSTCSPTATASSVTAGTTTVTGGPGILFNLSSGGALQASNTLPAGVNINTATGTSLALGGATIGTNVLAANGTVAIASNSSAAIAVGPNGATNPVWQIDASTASQAAGLKLTGAATGGTVALVATDSGTNTNLSINAKGSGTISIGGVSTGAVSIGGGGGGLTVTSSFTATGLVTFADMASAAVATSAQYIAGNASTLVPSNVAFTSETTTTFGATTSFDFSTFINTAVTLTGNITTMNVSNIKAGQAGQIRFIQDATGSRTTVWNSVFKFAGGIVPALTTSTPNAIDVLFYSCVSSSLCYASLTQNMK